MDLNQYKSINIYAPCTDFIFFLFIFVLINFCFLIIFWGVSLILINPGLVPQPEPYFDLTPIRVTHTKIFPPKGLNLNL